MARSSKFYPRVAHKRSQKECAGTGSVLQAPQFAAALAALQLPFRTCKSRSKSKCKSLLRPKQKQEQRQEQKQKQKQQQKAKAEAKAKSRSKSKKQKQTAKAEAKAEAKAGAKAGAKTEKREKYRNTLKPNPTEIPVPPLIIRGSFKWYIHRVIVGKWYIHRVIVGYLFSYILAKHEQLVIKQGE